MLEIPRSAWGARPPRYRRVLAQPTPELFVHHEGSHFDGTTPAQEVELMRAIQAFHMNGRGWSDIAYNHVVMPSGRAYEGRGWGIQGGATFNHNARSHAICWAGDFMVQTPTPASIAAGRALIAEGIAGRHITGESILGHRDASGGYPENNTACPGNNLEALLPLLRRHSGPPPWPGRYLHLTTPYMQGHDVATWQRALAHHGLPIGVDGIFGTRTSQATRDFQHRAHLAVDGIVGPHTWAAGVR